MADSSLIYSRLLSIPVSGERKSLVTLNNFNTTRPFDSYLLIDRFNAENGTHLKLIPNALADAGLCANDSNVWGYLPRGFPVNTAIAYEKPNVALGKEIVYPSKRKPRVILATGKYQGEKGIALVTQGLGLADIVYTSNGRSRSLAELSAETDPFATDYKKLTEIQLIMREEQLIAIPNFPTRNGFYVLHEQTGIPHARAKGVLDIIEDALTMGPPNRSLFRLGSSYVGLVIRGIMGRLGMRAVYATSNTSDCFGVAAEVPTADIQKIKQLISIAQTEFLPPQKEPGSIN